MTVAEWLDYATSLGFHRPSPCVFQRYMIVNCGCRGSMAHVLKLRFIDRVATYADPVIIHPMDVVTFHEHATALSQGDEGSAHNDVEERKPSSELDPQR